MSKSQTRSAEVRVAVVDDDAMMCDSITALLSSVGIRTTCFADPARFLRSVGKLQVDCILLDVRMPGMSGIELQQALNERGIRTPVVFISAHGDIPMALKTVRAGALDFLEKPFRDEDLLQRIHEASRITRSPRNTSELKEFMARFAEATRRESQVAWLIADGLSNAEIAGKLRLSRRTVEMHRLRLMRRLGLKKSNELVSLLVEARAVNATLGADAAER